MLKLYVNISSMCITHCTIILHLISVEGEIEQESKMKLRAYFQQKLYFQNMFFSVVDHSGLVNCIYRNLQIIWALSQGRDRRSIQLNYFVYSLGKYILQINFVAENGVIICICVLHILDPDACQH